MTLRQCSVAVIVGLCVLGFCLACKHHVSAAARTASLSVTNGACAQSPNPVPVSNGDTVTWSTGSATTGCSISFTNTQAGCPFYGGNCSYTCTNGTVTSDQVTSTAPTATQYQFSSWSIGNTNCSIGSDGLVMR